MFIPLNQDINRLTFERDTIKGEVIELLKERDKIREEISSQRLGKTIVSLETVTLWDVKFLLEEQSLILSKINWKSYSEFLSNYKRQEDHLKQIEVEILAKKAELAKFNDLMGKNKELEDKIKLWEIKYQEIQKNSQEIQSQTVEIMRWLNKEQVEIEKNITSNLKILDDIQKEKQSLIKLRWELDMKEKRYLKLTAKENVKSWRKK